MFLIHWVIDSYFMDIIKTNIISLHFGLTIQSFESSFYPLAPLIIFVNDEIIIIIEKWEKFHFFDRVFHGNEGEREKMEQRGGYKYNYIRILRKVRTPVNKL